MRERRPGEARDELERSNEELSRFSYVCSHDMKEPVRLIASMVEMLQEPQTRADEEDMAELLTRIGNNTHRLSAIICSLLAYSRVEARIEIVPVDLNVVAAEINENLSLLVSERKAELQIFGIFTRLELNSEIEGSGLGLAICKRIVSQYDGTITRTDSDIGGTRFTISLPEGVH